MMVIFNEKGLLDCQPPCLVQNLINHNAILYKLFIVNDCFHIIERPSLKNFYSKDCEIMNTIFFSSHDISKSGSNSKWSVILKEEQSLTAKPKFEIFEKIVKKVEQIFGLFLVGVDVVIENNTEKYAIIDVNVFPGYDGYPNFFNHLVYAIKKLLKDKRSVKFDSCPSFKKSLSSDFDSGFESDEKKNQFVL
jgi:inositol-1,3,4-trisphosphate 5/6-kinase/inositol-tetrakisphosphate 1-kinase